MAQALSMRSSNPPKQAATYICLRYLLTALSVMALCMATACNQGPGAGVKWTNYPSLAAPGTTKTYNWLVVKCQFNDVPTIPSGLDTDINQFLGLSGNGYGNISDYFFDVSYNHAEIVGNVSLPWVKAPFATTKYPGRQAGVQQCLNAVPTNLLPDLDSIWGVVVVSNFVQDGGACYIGQAPMLVGNTQHNLACVWFDPNSLKTEFAAHEFGHGLGLNHSYDDSQRNCGGNPGEYCDPWDIMSAQGTYQFVDKNFLTSGQASGGGPGMNAPNLISMGWLNLINQIPYFANRGDQTFTLRALSQPRGDAPLAVIVQTDNPDRAESIYTVEYRQGTGWDLGFATDGNTPAKVRESGGVVLVHKYRPVGAPASTLINGAFSGALQPCDTLILENGSRYIHVSAFDTRDGSATIVVGAGRGKFFPCFNNLVTQKVETRAAQHFVGDNDEGVKQRRPFPALDPSVPVPPVVVNPPGPPNPNPPR